MPRFGLASFTKTTRVVREIRDPAATRSCQVSVLPSLCSFALNPHAYEIANAEHAFQRSTQREQITYNQEAHTPGQHTTTAKEQKNTEGSLWKIASR